MIKTKVQKSVLALDRAIQLQGCWIPNVEISTATSKSPHVGCACRRENEAELCQCVWMTFLICIRRALVDV